MADEEIIMNEEILDEELDEDLAGVEEEAVESESEAPLGELSDDELDNITGGADSWRYRQNVEFKFCKNQKVLFRNGNKGKWRQTVITGCYATQFRDKSRDRYYHAFYSCTLLPKGETRVESCFRAM